MKGNSLQKLKDKAAEAKNKVVEATVNVDVKGSLNTMSEKATKATESGKQHAILAKESIGNSIEQVKDVDWNEKTAEFSDAGKAQALRAKVALEGSMEQVKDVDWSEQLSADNLKSQFVDYKDLALDKVGGYLTATFEIDKDTSEIVESLKGKLPVPVQNTEDLLDQCKNDALRRAAAAFFLTPSMMGIDDHSAQKYDNLSESYKNFSDKVGHGMFDDPNFADMKDTRHSAKQSFSTLDNGYNEGSTLMPYDTDIDHVISRKNYFDDLLLKAGTTDDEFISAINSKENLVFADSSLNRSLQDKDIHSYLQERGTPRADNPDLIDIEINGETKTVSLASVDEAVNRAEESQLSQRVDAAIEIGTTMVTTGALMAAQQVVGLIVVETIDIFIEEIKMASKNFNMTNPKEMAVNSKEFINRVSCKLNKRFEERDIWAKAKAVGIEAGVSGALSVLPQIILATVTKLPSFMLAIVREGTLSLVRSVRVLASDNDNKLQAIGVIMAATASAVVGLYISRIISTGIASIPLLNRFNNQITNVLSGLCVTAIPLIAIYIFDQNKDKFSFTMPRISRPTTVDA